MGCPVVTKKKRVRKRVDLCDWKLYSGWQKGEALLACQRLRSLVETAAIHDWDRTNGRPRIARRVIVLCLLVKAYFHLSYRRVWSLLALLQPVLGLVKVPHYNTMAKYRRMAGLTPALKRLLGETARPYWLTEEVVTHDASGLLWVGSGAWRSNHDPEARRDFGKIHVLSGAKRRATLAVVSRGARGTTRPSSTPSWTRSPRSRWPGR